MQYKANLLWISTVITSGKSHRNAENETDPKEYPSQKPTVSCPEITIHKNSVYGTTTRTNLCFTGAQTESL
jgi:hypothetical protein